MPEENTANVANEIAVPEPVRAFLISPQTIDRRIGIFDDAGISPMDGIKLGRLLNRLYDKNLPLASLLDEATAALNGNADSAKKIVLALAGNELLAVSDYLGDVAGYIRSLGGDPESFSVKRITLRSVRPQDIVTEVLHENPVSVPAYLEHRLREILESRARSVRKDAETIQRLTRAEKIGGVEMSKEDAEAIVEKLASKVAAVKISADMEIAPSANPAAGSEHPASPPPPAAGAPVAIPVARGEAPLPVQSPDAAAQIKTAADKASRAGHGVTEHDEREAEEIRAKVLPKLVTSELFDLDKEVATAADGVFAMLGPKLPAAYRERFRSIIVSRLRGVRDAAETGDLLTRPLSQGGLGLGQELAGTILAELDRRLTFISSKKVEALRKEKEAFVKTSVETAYAKDESRKANEQEELNRLYGALTGKKGAPAPSAVAPAPGQPAAAAQVQAAPPSRPAPSASPYLYTPPAVPNPKIHDVRPSSAPSAGRLMGPIEELKNMTVVDFRRLSADPAEACRKISDKLDMLADHAYAQRLEGVKAWRESETYRNYLALLSASFAGGRPVQAIVAEALAADKPTLTEREVRAIMELNRSLKA